MVAELDRMIHQYLEEEQLVDGNQYHCSACGGLNDGTRKVELVQAPPCLIVSLLRFEWVAILPPFFFFFSGEEVLCCELLMFFCIAVGLFLVCICMWWDGGSCCVLLTVRNVTTPHMQV